jgi:hypothetical protein
MAAGESRPVCYMTLWKGLCFTAEKVRFTAFLYYNQYVFRYNIWQQESLHRRGMEEAERCG